MWKFLLQLYKYGSILAGLEFIELQGRESVTGVGFEPIGNEYAICAIMVLPKKLHKSEVSNVEPVQCSATLKHILVIF